MQTQPKPRSLLSKLVIGTIVLIVLCCALSSISRQFSQSTPTASAPGAQANTVVVKIYTPAPGEGDDVTSPPANTPEPAATETPQPTDTPVPVGSTKENPAPVGTAVNAKEFSIVVNRVVRPADKIVAEGNMFNKAPESGQEYVQIFVTITCSADAKTKCSASPYDFKLSGSNGIVYDAETFLAGVDGMLESTEFYGGAKLEEKSIFFLAGTGETNAVMEFEAGLLFRESAFFAIPDQSQ